MAERVSATQLAAILGISKARVGQGIKSGKLKNSARPADNGIGYSIDPELAAIEWAESNGRPDLPFIDHKTESVRFDRQPTKQKPPAASQPAPKPSQKGGKAKRAAAAAPAIAPPIDPDDLDGDPLFDAQGRSIPTNLASQRQLNYYRAEKAKRDHLVAEGALVPIADVGRVVAAEYANLRKALVGLGVGLAQELALVSNEGDVKRIINDAVNEALRNISADETYADDTQRAG